MVYDWDVHQKTCYQLYIDEGRSLEDIMDHLRSVHKFTPSKRAFQTQFKRWNFPSKQKPAYKNERLVNRIRELWERNLTQREILRVLNEEDGFDIKQRELMRVRSRNRWLLRVSPGDTLRPLEPRSPDHGALQEMGQEDGDSTLSLPDDENASFQQVVSSDPADPGTRVPQQGHVDTNAPLDKNGKKKRSRPSVNSPGRFPSEMTLDQARRILGLEFDTYREIRSSFRKICSEEDVSKKTLAGPDRWDAVKDRLINEYPQLQEVMWILKGDIETKRLAMDIICTDVTKRVRNMESRMSLTEAKNILKLNPEECREARFAFYTVLGDAHLTCKSDTTTAEWEELKRKWLERSEPFKTLVASGRDLTTQETARAIEILAEDVMKRLRDDQHRREQESEQEQPQILRRRQRQQHQQEEDKREDKQSSPSASAFAISTRRTSSSSQLNDSSHRDDVDMDDGIGNGGFDAISEVSHASRMPFASSGASIASHLPLPIQSQSSGLSDSSNDLPQPHRVLGSSIPTGVSLNSQMGPSLFLTANPQVAFMGQQQYVQHPYAAAATSSGSVFHTVQPISTSMAVWLKLHPSSTFVTNSALWIGTMTAQSLQSLRHTAVEKFPGALCGRVEGIVKDGKGGELPLHIQDDEELRAYLEHLQGGTPTFAVQLVC
ncbi:hypothetical protein BGZ63DRAFT_346248 [Mariannaea sp. PMI_226]|nr:hypothetical protein BGZ63DRAFT_346248 [Mariannaea sp. PMI_226]